MRRDKPVSVAIIGGGAAGLTAAIAASETGANVRILEHMDRVGKKILSTGNGRCNLTNLVMNAACYRSSQPDFPMKVIDRFPVQDTLCFFERLGILPKNKNGYLYPNSEQASAVLDSLRFQVQKLGIAVECGCHVTKLVPQHAGDDGFILETCAGRRRADRVILAAGSRAAPVTGSDGSGYRLAAALGHHIVPVLPALVQLCCDGKYFKQIAGVRCEAKLTLFADGRKLAEDTGELQLTDYGISGIPTFQISRFATAALHNRQTVTVQIDFLPSKTKEESDRMLMERAVMFGDRLSGELLTGVFHKKLAQMLTKQAGIGPELPAASVPADRWRHLADLIRGFPVTVTSSKSFEQAQICCGGIDVSEVSDSTMESKLIKNLYFAGEILDVDGICGGYNLQWAWSSGMIAGRTAGRIK